MTFPPERVLPAGNRRTRVEGAHNAPHEGAAESRAHAALMCRWNSHVLAVFGDGTAGHLNTFGLQTLGNGFVRQRTGSIILFTLRFKISKGVAVPPGPCTASEKKYRNSYTPWGVCAYLLETARLTVDGWTPISSAISLIIMGRRWSIPLSRKSVCRRTMDWQTFRIVCFRCSMFFMSWIADA